MNLLEVNNICKTYGCALLRRSEGLEDVRRRTLQTDGIDLDQRIVLQSVVIEHFHRLVVAGEDAVDAHVAGLIQLLDAGQQAGSLHLDHHVAVFQHTLDREAVAILLDVSNIGHLITLPDTHPLSPSVAYIVPHRP